MLPTGMPSNALAVISDALAKGVSIAQVNVMAMDFGSAYDNGGQMGLSAIRSAWATMSQLEGLAPSLSHAQAARMVGVTVMIGQNDLSTEVFKLSDIPQLVSDGKNQGLAMLSFWSATRDKAGVGFRGTATPVVGVAVPFSLDDSPVWFGLRVPRAHRKYSPGP